MFDSYLAPQFGPREPRLTIDSACGKHIKTREHGELFDATSGYWYAILGFGNPEMVAFKERYAGNFTHTFGSVTNDFAETLAIRLIGLTDMESVILSLSGSMANENARKEAVNYHRARGRPEKSLVFGAIKGGYHGSIGEMLRMVDPRANELVIESPCYKKSDEIAQIVGAFRTKFEAIEKSGRKVAGFFFEPVMGVRGAVFLPEDYLLPIAQICREKDILLIADEVTTGFGRTGKYFGCEHTGVKPDIVCLGKGISGGYYPLSATLVNKKIVEAWSRLESVGVPFHDIHSRGNSLAGTPEGCAAGLKVIELLGRDSLVEEVARKGSYALEKLSSLRNCPHVRDVRGKGLLIAVDVENSALAGKIREEMLNRAIHFIPEGRMVMFVPAYPVTEEEIDNFTQSLDGVLRKI
ncbi:aspartate aminotransferase family protein [Candidatus Woesearchaeota archaeon]|nr:aspartate aminotransferase family protein [Candidatus Woesearchaeota archaeon]